MDKCANISLSFLVELLEEQFEVLLVFLLNRELLVLDHLVECGKFVLLTIVLFVVIAVLISRPRLIFYAKCGFILSDDRSGSWPLI